MTNTTHVRIERDDLSRKAVRALVAEHLQDMYATSPPESVHALGLDALVGPGMTLWSAWRGEELLGFAALKALDERHAEIKSMHVLAEERGRGLASVLLDGLMLQLLLTDRPVVHAEVRALVDGLAAPDHGLVAEDEPPVADLVSLAAIPHPAAFASEHHAP